MDLEEIVRLALAEDIGSGDITTELLVEKNKKSGSKVISRIEGVLSGSEPFEEVFRQLDPMIEIIWAHHDGEYFSSEAVICEIEGSTHSILTGERTALNFLGKLSGIATLTRRFVDSVKETNAIILDTRKTTPLLRMLEKAAVRHGGGGNHRLGLYDMVLIKDNHEDAAGGIISALERVKEGLVDEIGVEIEIQNPAQIEEVLKYKVDRIMLDNFDIDMIREAVEKVSGRVPLEVSGGVTLESVIDIANTGVEYISIGALTHSAPGIDFSMKTNI